MTNKAILVAIDSELQKNVKVFCAQHEITIKSFIESAIREKYNKNTNNNQ